MSEKPRTGRWLQFGLGTLLGLVLLAGLFLGYTAWWMNRLREVEQRNEDLVKQLEKQRLRAEEQRLLRELERIRIQTVAGTQPAPDDGEPSP